MLLARADAIMTKCTAPSSLTGGAAKQQRFCLSLSRDQLVSTIMSARTEHAVGLLTCSHKFTTSLLDSASHLQVPATHSLSDPTDLMGELHSDAAPSAGPYLWIIGGLWPCKYTRPHKICQAQRFRTSESMCLWRLRYLFSSKIF